MEVAKGSDRGDGVAGPQGEHVGRADARGAVLTRRRRGDADVEAERALAGGVAGEGVVVAARSAGRVARDEVEDVLRAPNGGVGLGNGELGEADGVLGGNVELEVVTRGEGDFIRGVDGLKREFLDEGGDGAVGDDAEGKRFLQAGAGGSAAVALHPAVARALEQLGDARGELTLAQLARRCSASEARLSGMFARQIGVPLTRYRNSLRLGRFWDHYRGGDMQRTAAESVYAAGFGSYAQFHRVFTQAYGHGPHASLRAGRLTI